MKKIIIYFNNGDPNMELDYGTYGVYAEEGFIYINNHAEAPYGIKYIIPLTEIKRVEFD